ncbi:hypothetical protein Tsubulata_011131 [Turnera subulata]|uniref:Uncharacterized protein n=1 Tax=Turnera subulata TaxID=218843 RepID=A0A9Q0FG73_9ROSI|nr:hypothetical protein Tsubulata_011131 [Turnera subulata]
MAMGMMSVTVPTVVAAAGIYFFDSSNSKAQELGNGARSSLGSLVSKVKKGVKKTSEMPKFAPQLDGLNCFETLILH